MTGIIVYVVVLATFVAALIIKAEDKPINMKAVVFLMCFAVFMWVAFKMSFIDWNILGEEAKIEAVFTMLAYFSLMLISYWVYNESLKVKAES
ncbi:MAG: hypothetical protein QW175_04375 [Candidatus Bathyarchaeia archaeon]